MSKRFRGRKGAKPKITALADLSPVTSGPTKADVNKAAVSNITPPTNSPLKLAKIEKSTCLDINNGTSVLYQILSMKRPAWSKTEEKMITQFIDPLKPVIDKFGNRILTIPHIDGSNSKTLFCCHTDTVHRSHGIQKIYLDTAVEEVFVDDSSNCLGADDGTGVYIMLVMIRNKVPGTYLFHRAEEIGCLGSNYIRSNNSDWLKQFNAAISFDRKNDNEVIIAQSPGIIASEEYGNALCTSLNAHKDEKKKLKYKNSKLGTITDSGQYYEHIGECINLSVGYMNQHSPRETQSITHLQMLLPQLIATKWDDLPITRKPGAAKAKYTQPAYNSNNDWYGRQNRGCGYGSYNNKVKEKEPVSLFDNVPAKKLAALVMNDPRIAIELLIDAGITAEDLWAAEWAVQQTNTEYLEDFNEIYGLT